MVDLVLMCIFILFLGQAIPRGLHVRMNFETSITEAKLLDPEEEDESKEDGKLRSLSVLPEHKNNNATQNDTVTVNEPKKFKKADQFFKEELQEVLKNIPSDRFEVKDKLRTLEEIKTVFKAMKMSMKTDAEVIKGLFERYEFMNKFFPPTNNNVKDKLEEESVDSPAAVEILNILIDLEYLVHQFDNALEFVRLEGFEKIVYPQLNSSDSALKAEAIKLMGSCLQNNLQVQIHALETNAGDHLLKILALEKNEHVKAKAVYALSCLVRRYPIAQKQIFSKHGMDVMHKILLSDNPAYVKLKIKVIVLLEDLVLEHQSVLENHTPGNVADEEKLKQYYQVDLMSKLANPISCDILSRLLQEYFNYDSSNVDHIDKIFSVINTFSHICKHHHYKDTNLLILFHNMQILYGQIVSERKKDNSDESLDDTEFYIHVLDMIENYMNVLNEAKIKDEL